MANLRSRTRTRSKAPARVTAAERSSRHRNGTYAFVRNVFSRYRRAEGWTPNPVTATMLLCIIRVAGALQSPIADCDETFNYWEPLHYMLHGWGLQTWEYAPQFALRSYAFLLPYAAVARVSAWVAVDKVGVFYAVRITQALVSALAEAALYDATVWRFGTERSRVLLVLLVGSPGIFRAAGEFLPSSFAMVLLTFAWARWLVGEFGNAVAMVAIASLLGWVYVVAAAVPMALHIVYRRGLLSFVRYAMFIGVPLVAAMLAIDTHYYGVSVLVPLRHLMYNVFPVPGAGPELFGVEQWSFYVQNLVLNLPLVAPLIALFPLQALLHIGGTRVWGEPKYAVSRVIFLSGPLLLLAQFFAVPHKEERFLAPLYPLLCLLAAVSLVDWVDLMSRILPRRVQTPVAQLSISVFLVAGCALGASRVAMQHVGYGGSLRVYERLAREEFSKMEASGDIVNICVSKEWHRFPSHFFVPHPRMRVRFLSYGFDGQLPKYYSENVMGSRIEPKGMNMLNKADPSQWFNVTATDGCHYFIDLDLSHRTSKSKTKEEHPIPINARRTVFKESFLDSEQSPAGLRAFYVPIYSHKLIYGQYVAVRNSDLLRF